MEHTFIKADAPADVWEDTTGHSGGPERNLGKEYSRRAVWSTDDPDMPYCVVTEYAYVNGMVWTLEDGEETERREAQHEDLDLPVYDHYRDEDEPYPDGDYIVFLEQEMVEAIYCTDPDDPGGTERDSEYQYNDIGYMWPRSLAEAEENCKEHIKYTNFETMYF